MNEGDSVVTVASMFGSDRFSTLSTDLCHSCFRINIARAKSLTI